MIPRRIFWLFDLITLILAFLLSYRLLPLAQLPLLEHGRARAWAQTVLGPMPLGPVPPLGDWLWVGATMIPLTILLLGLWGGHAPVLVQSRTRIVVGSALAPLAALSVTTLALFAVKTAGSSRLFVFSFVFLSIIGLAVYRLSLRWYCRQRQAAGQYARQVVFVGPVGGVERLTRHFAKHISAADYRVVGRVCVDGNGANGASTVTDPLTLQCHAAELGGVLYNYPVHEVVVIQPRSGGDWVEQVVNDCNYLGVTLRIVPEPLLPADGESLVARYPLQPLNLPAVVLDPPASAHAGLEAEFFKRLLDITAAATLLVLLSPLLAVIALAVKLTDPDQPVLYAWQVVGQNGVRFTGYKFRTMVPNADELKGRLMAQNEMSGPVFKIKDDPRITPVGRLLRKFSLDELPQLWSVLRGDMSLVGPRPAGVSELPRYEFWHKRKLSIKSGMTCLWQVRGRNQIRDFDEWVKLDLEYIDHWSLWLDVKILFQTAWAVVRGTGE